MPNRSSLAALFAAIALFGCGKADTAAISDDHQMPGYPESVTLPDQKACYDACISKPDDMNMCPAIAAAVPEQPCPYVLLKLRRS